MDKNELTTQLIEAKFSVLDRMVAAGWITQLARTNADASVEFTEKGRALLSEIQRLFNLGGPMNSAELTAFCRIIGDLHQVE